MHRPVLITGPGGIYRMAWPLSPRLDGVEAARLADRHAQSTAELWHRVACEQSRGPVVGNCDGDTAEYHRHARHTDPDYLHPRPLGKVRTPQPKGDLWWLVRVMAVLAVAIYVLVALMWLGAL